MPQFQHGVLLKCFLMMKKRLERFYLGFIVLIFSCSSVYSQSIFSQLENKNNTSKSSVKIHQDQRIESLVYGIKKQKEEKLAAEDVASVDGVDAKELAGYRVQVYSSNIQKSAKAEAFRIEEELQQLLPDVPVYVFYHAPFWKVRAGNCRTMEEAQNLRNEIGTAYPQVKRDLYVVRDKIKVAAK